MDMGTMVEMDMEMVVPMYEYDVRSDHDPEFG
jgi:hypothetical protein